MLKIYDKNCNYIRGIVDYKEARTEQELNITDTLLFRIPKSLGDIFEEEGYVETKEAGRFVIKEKNLIQEGYEIVGKYDLEDLFAWVESKAYVTQDIITMGEDLLEGTGWQIKYGDEWGRNYALNTTTPFIGLGAGIDNYDIDIYSLTSDLNEWITSGENYTISFDWEVDTPLSEPMIGLVFWNVSPWTTGSHRYTIPIGEKTGSAIITVPMSQVMIDANPKKLRLRVNKQLSSDNRLTLHNFKIEKGTKATPHSPAPEDLTLPKRTVTGTNMTILELLYKSVDTFRYDIRFDNVNKIIYVADELGSDKGVYFHDEVNLKSLNTTSDTYDFATRLIPVGFDGMGIEFINDGLPYVENHTYSDKVITQIWQDERYTVIENLKEDAEKRLEKIAKPLRSYSADVNDLSRHTEYKILAYEVGDIITLIDKESNTREKQRIIKKVKYLDEVGKDTVEIANRPRYLGDEQEKIIENLRSSFNITRASLELFEDSIVGRVSEIEGVASEIREDFEGNKVEVDARITENTSETQQLATEITKRVSQEEYDKDYNLINENLTEVKQEIGSIRNTIQIGGGNNLIKNSVGYGELNYWTKEDGEVDYGMSTWILEGTSKHGWIISHGAIYQNIDLLPNVEHTLSGRLLKNTEAGIVSIGLYDREADDLIHEVIRKEVETFDGQFSFQFSSGQDRNLRLKIEVQEASTINPVELTDLMLAQGVNYDVWSQASGEIYTLNVKMDGKGITVFSADNRGKTVMSPEEFAGYYNNQKIFTLNGDITEVMGLKIGGKGLFIPPVKFVQTQNSLDVVWTGR